MRRRRFVQWIYFSPGQTFNWFFNIPPLLQHKYAFAYSSLFCNESETKVTRFWFEPIGRHCRILLSPSWKKVIAGGGTALLYLLVHEPNCILSYSLFMLHLFFIVVVIIWLWIIKKYVYLKLNLFLYLLSLFILCK